MNRKVRRLVVLAAGVLGLLAASAGAAHAHILGNHCEPERRQGDRS